MEKWNARFRKKIYMANNYRKQARNYSLVISKFKRIKQF